MAHQIAQKIVKMSRVLIGPHPQRKKLLNRKGGLVQNPESLLMFVQEERAVRQKVRVDQCREIGEGQGVLLEVGLVLLPVITDARGLVLEAGQGHIIGLTINLTDVMAEDETQDQNLHLIQIIEVHDDLDHPFVVLEN
jgi:hypothetical protein